MDSDETGGSIIGRRRSPSEMTIELENLCASPHFKTRQLTLADTPTKGRLGDYHIINAYRTKASEVYVCLRDMSESQPPIAFKTFRHEFTFDPVARRAFRRECAVWARASIAFGILPFWGLQEIEGRTFVAMPGVLPGPGGVITLKDLIRHELPPLEMVVFYAQMICSSLAAAGMVVPGIVHGDLKPSNILLMWGNVPFISDFGVARAAAHGLGGDTLLGTQAYCSPLARNPSAKLSVLDDVYSFGTILEELLIEPRRRSGRRRTVRKTLNDNPTTSVRAKLLTLARQCSSQSPSERPRNFDAIVEKLDLIAPQEQWPIPDQVEVVPNPIPSPFRVKSAAQTLLLLEEYDSVLKFLAGRYIGVRRYVKQHWELSLYKGIAYSETNRSVRARASLRRAKAICAAQKSESESNNANLDLIMYYYALAHRRDRTRKAENLLQYQAVNSVNPGNASAAVYSLAVIYAQTDRNTEAKALLQNLSTKEDAGAQVWSQLGTVYMRLKEFELAIEACQRAVDMEPSNPAYYNNLGQALLRIPARAEEALRMFAHAIDAGDASQETLTRALIAANITDDGTKISQLTMFIFERVGNAAEFNRISALAFNTANRLRNGTLPTFHRPKGKNRRRYGNASEERLHPW